LLLVLSVWRALLRVRLCLYYFPGRLEELLFQKSFILFFSSSSFWPFSSIEATERVHGPHLFLSFYRHGKGVPEIVPLSNLRARALTLLFLLNSKTKAPKEKENEGESGRLASTRSRVVCVKRKKKKRRFICINLKQENGAAIDV
jgi:hypothetical protein